MFSFVLKASGGDDGHLLKQTESYVRSKARHTALRTEIYDAISQDCKGASQRILCRHALLKVGFIHPGIVEKSHCSAMLSSDSEKDEPEKMMVTLRSIVNGMGDGFASSLPVKTFVQSADMRIISHALKLNIFKDPKKMDALMHKLIEELRFMTSADIPFGEFKDCKEKSEPKKETPASSDQAPTILPC
jgi:hypothetical protein